jgi:hypothetical protein
VCGDHSGRYLYLIDLTIRRVVAELFRGRSNREIRSISISYDNLYIAVITEKSKICLFFIENVTKSRCIILSLHSRVRRAGPEGAET